ncbi:50S ribosomal protein L14 [Candidatus Curtissbacteria bacterium RBG_16_39_7]|uniref:Large ribosomal subunit protein uL14 n=1 Tax=Candidatus Curtissbacteria bacterium RBG_16_39_7 TaxID=1797707 RepID=A0A1F5G1H3_9BACT|nr:MAG: 50S ribosomal protein L14 [Candidatus Curtissbacteria bacterium RBG_16_39_7]
MLQHRSILKVADNTGAHKLMLIGIPGHSRKKSAKLGDVVTCTVKAADPNGLVKTHQIVLALIIRTKKEVSREDGSYIRFSDNAAVIVDKTRVPLGSRIFGPVAREIKDKKNSKIISMAPEVW